MRSKSAIVLLAVVFSTRVGIAADAQLPSCMPVPKLLKFIEPTMPAGKSFFPAGGAVFVELTITRAGTVSDVAIVKTNAPSAPPWFNGAVVKAVEAWKFESPVQACRAQMPMKFNPKN